jgi:hypothetical protein
MEIGFMRECPQMQITKIIIHNSSLFNGFSHKMIEGDLEE